MLELDLPYAHNGDIQKEMYVYFLFGIKRTASSAIRIFKWLLINKVESQSIPVSDDPRNKGLILQVEMSLYECPKFFARVFYHDIIYYKSILLCLLLFIFLPQL